MKAYEITEAMPSGKFDDSKLDLVEITARVFTGATKLKDIHNNLAIYKKENYYSLIKDNAEVYGFAILSPKVIAGINYTHVDRILILPNYRKTAAINWLIYAIKEIVSTPIIADGAIFADGNKLIQQLIKHNIFQVSALNTQTGQKEKLTEPIADINYCYIFESTGLGFKSEIFSESIGAEVWYTFFDII